MTPPATQEGIIKAVGLLSGVKRVIAVICCCLVSAIVAAGFWPSTARGQEIVAAPIQTKAAEQANKATPQSPHSADQDKKSGEDHAQWRPLLDEQLSGWEVFTGVPHKSVEIEGVPQSDSHDCRKGTPVGLGDPKNVYSVTIVDGAPVLRVSGEVYAGLTSLEDFEDFHFSTEFKWGEKTWPPRRKVKRDSGILFHCTGKHGAFWNAWMCCIECQIQEGDCGDFISLAGTSCQVKVTAETYGDTMPQHSLDGKWCNIGTGFGNWGAKRLGNHEIKGDWNRIEIHTVDDKAVFSVNGHRVMRLQNARVGKRKSRKPLTGGKIQIQSEAAEVWYRDMKIRPIKKLPADMATHYGDH